MLVGFSGPLCSERSFDVGDTRPERPGFSPSGTPDPTKHFFDQFVFPLAECVALMSRGAIVDRTAPISVVLSHVRSDVDFPHACREGARLIAAIPTERRPTPPRLAADHRLCGFTFRWLVSVANRLPAHCGFLPPRVPGWPGFASAPRIFLYSRGILYGRGIAPVNHACVFMGALLPTPADCRIAPWLQTDRLNRPVYKWLVTNAARYAASSICNVTGSRGDCSLSS